MATACPPPGWPPANKRITNRQRRTQLQPPADAQPNPLHVLFTLLVFSSLLRSIAGDGQPRAPVIIEQPVDVTVRRNDPATLNCKTEGYPPPAVEWIKDGIKIRASKNPMILPSGSLFFFQVDQVCIDSTLLIVVHC